MPREVSKHRRPQRIALVIGYIAAGTLTLFGLAVVVVGLEHTVMAEGMTERWIDYRPSPFGWVPLALGLLASLGLATRRFAIVFTAAAAMVITGIPLVFNVGIPLMGAGPLIAGVGLITRPPRG